MLLKSRCDDDDEAQHEFVRNLSSCALIMMTHLYFSDDDVEVQFEFRYYVYKYDIMYINVCECACVCLCVCVCDYVYYNPYT